MFKRVTSIHDKKIRKRNEIFTGEKYRRLYRALCVSGTKKNGKQRSPHSDLRTELKKCKEKKRKLTGFLFYSKLRHEILGERASRLDQC